MSTTTTARRTLSRGIAPDAPPADENTAPPAPTAEKTREELRAAAAKKPKRACIIHTPAMPITYTVPGLCGPSVSDVREGIRRFGAAVKEDDTPDTPVDGVQTKPLTYKVEGSAGLELFDRDVNTAKAPA